MSSKLCIKVLYIMLLYNLQYAMQSELSSAANISEIYRAVLAKADVTKNFLIAPKQIELLLNDFVDSKQQNISAEIETIQLNEIFSFPIKYPIEVTNTVVTKDEKIREFYAEKLEKTKLNYQASVLMPPAMLNSTTVELINSVSVQAGWTFNFQKRDTHKGEFYHSQNQHSHYDSMHKDDVFNYGVLEELNATALELSLHHSLLHLLIILPNERDGLAALEQRLRDYNVVEEIWRKRLRPTLSRVFMPKFKISYSVQLANLLDGSSYDPKILNILHEAQIEVSEDGLGQYRRNTVLFWNVYSSLRSTPQRFAMEHPFFFLIRDKDGIQFVGHLVY